MMTLLKQLSNEMADLAGDVSRSVVQITDGRGSIGAGTVWHSDGLIVTNAHVVAGVHRQRMRGRFHRHGFTHSRQMNVVLSDGRTLPAKVLAIDETHDLAALTVDANDLPTIEAGESRGLRPGQWVMAFGHPWGVRDSMTAGVVIGSGDNLPEMQPGREWVALNLTLRPGHSGGPLVNTDGRLIGVNTMISGPEVGFAVPVHVVKGFLKEALGGKHTPDEQEPGEDTPVHPEAITLV